MSKKIIAKKDLKNDLASLGLQSGDGVWVHASMRSIGPVIGGPRVLIEALLETVGENGLVGMPGFSADAYFPDIVDRATCSHEEIERIEQAVPGFDLKKTPSKGVGAMAELFRNWPGTLRSHHPTTSVCLNGIDAGSYVEPHSLAWACGPDTPFGTLMRRPQMKILLIGVGWNRCTPLHTGESLAEQKRTKTRRCKVDAETNHWTETPDVADDLNRLFPLVGSAFEESGAVTVGALGKAECRLCSYPVLVNFAADWINKANAKSGDLH